VLAVDYQQILACGLNIYIIEFLEGNEGNAPLSSCCEMHCIFRRFFGIYEIGLQDRELADASFVILAKCWPMI
jgi:hypothetical protein